jgi:hypothetical protein
MDLDGTKLRFSKFAMEPLLRTYAAAVGVAGIAR